MKPAQVQSDPNLIKPTYNGSFQSYLATISELIRNREFPFSIAISSEEQQNTLFGQEYSEAKERKRAERFWHALSKKGLHIPRLIYFAFLSERAESAQVIAEYICLLFGHYQASERSRKELQQDINRWARAVEEEKLYCENHAVFLRKKNRIPVCYLKPKYNVLPLLTRHFRSQFGNLNWGVYDQGRSYGVQVRDGILSYWSDSDYYLKVPNWKNGSDQSSVIREAV